MKTMLYPTTLFAATLLLGTLGCSKKSDPAASSDSSYQLDGVTIPCQPKASTSTSSAGGIAIDYLTVDLVTTTPSTTGPETLRLQFVKPRVQSNTVYTLTDITLTTKGRALPDGFTVDTATLTPTSNGGYAGTFSGKNIAGPTAGPSLAITNGKFTNVRP